MWYFLKQFLVSPWQTGALLPSGKYLIDAMLKPVNFQNANSLLEIGAGSGVFTRAILNKMPQDSKLTVLEINEEFCRNLCEIKDSRLHVICGDACRLSTYISSADFVTRFFIISI